MSYETTPIGQWTLDCWFAFYRFLETMLEHCTIPGMESGNTINNPVKARSGDTFYTKWWYVRRHKDNAKIKIYLDIQVRFFVDPSRHPDEWLFYKVDTSEWTQDNDERVRVRDRCCERIRVKAMQMNRREITIPPKSGEGKLGIGNYMTFARINRRNWLGGNDDIINKERVLENLHFYEKVLEECFAGN